MSSARSSTTPAQAGEPPVSTMDTVLETGAAVVQEFKPVNQICAHLNAFHVYASDTTRCVEANHYCSHLNQDVRQCLLFDSPDKGARLIGVEYMITPKLYDELPEEERKLWHSHVYEVKSGMLIMPQPSSSITPKVAWETAEKTEMKEVISLYGKVYHLWQVDRGDKIPLGAPELMLSFTDDNKVTEADGWKKWKARDDKFGVNSKEKAEQRADIPDPVLHRDVDAAWNRQ